MAVDQNLRTPIVVKSLVIKLSAQIENPMALFLVVCLFFLNKKELLCNVSV